MADLDGSGFSQLDRLLGLVRHTRELLDHVADDGGLSAEDASFLETGTLPHLEGILAGFHGWLRADAATSAELRFLLHRVAAMRVEPARTPAERSAALAEAAAEARCTADGARPRLHPRRPSRGIWPRSTTPASSWPSCPRVPEGDVRFPGGRRTYADIPAPRGPAELAGADRRARARAVEDRRPGRPSAPVDPAFRRTYGFFDAADRLGVRAFRRSGLTSRTATLA